MNNIELKICKKCGIELPIIDFHPHYGRSQGHRTTCKKCENERARQYRLSKSLNGKCTVCTNPTTKGRVCEDCKSKHVNQVKERRCKQKRRAITYKGNKCSLCKVVYPSYVFDFHHPQEKNFSLSALMSGKWERIEEELNKCDLLCANCHRLLHYKSDPVQHRRANRRYKYKRKAMALLGSTCCRCGLIPTIDDESLSAFDFHHILHTNKKSVGNLLDNAGWNVIRDEVSKCILVCANCHRIIHWEERNIPGGNDGKKE